MRNCVSTYIVAAMLALSLTASAQYSVNEITITATADSTFILITTSKPANFKKFTIDAPPRVGVDFFGAIINLPQKEYSIDRPGIIMAVRASQHTPAPNPVVRVVLDLVERAGVVNIRSHPEGVMLALYTKGYPQFKKWSSGRKKAVPETVAVPAETAAVAKPIVAPEETTAIVAKPETTAALKIAAEEIPPELAIYMRPETLIYKGITADKETIQVAKYIRNMVIYAPKGDDPYIIPKRTKEVPFGTQPVPSVENITVVGIVQAGNLKMAIMQDASGFGYIFAPGDSVEDGFCTAVTDTSVLFSLFEFGQERKIELPLVKPKKGEK